MKTLRQISRIITGIVFVFSGFVKAVDPLGSTYKFTDYFNAFHLGFLEPLALPVAVFLSSTELVLGITLLLGYRMRFASWILLIFMSFFTILTLIVALTNPVTDCGCFGDALILTNWETFFKNIVLMFFTLVIFTGRYRFPVPRGRMIEWPVIALFYTGAILFSLYNYTHLPLVDFRPYHVGTNIGQSMTLPEGAPKDEFSTELIYRNRETGKEKTFTMQNFPRDTAQWEFVDARSKLLKKGYEPPIHNFNITAPDGNDITSHILDEPGYTFLLISYDAARAETGAMRKADDLFHISQTLTGLDFYAVTASNEDVLNSVRAETGITYDFCLADEITLKTIVRSNPGLLLIHDGTILAKWGSDDFPGEGDLDMWQSVFRDYPLCEGCDPVTLSTPPYGSLPGKLETVLEYRNIKTDSVSSFTIDNFPRDKEEWVFVNSVTKKSPGSFHSPFEDLKITSVYGMDYTDIALKNPNVSFLVFLRSPFETNPQDLQKINELAGLAGEHLNVPFEFYGLASLPDEEIMRFSDEFPGPVEYYHVPEAAVKAWDFEEAMLVMLRGGKIEKVWKDGNLPDPAALDNLPVTELRPAGEVLLPLVMSEYKSLTEKRLVYLLIFAFFTLVFLIRTVLDYPLISMGYGREDR